MDQSSDATSPVADRPAGVVRDWRRVGIWLVAVTLAYNVGEAVVALWAGGRATSIALVGFGLDSLIECAAAGVLLWHLSAERRGVAEETIERRERGVHRFVGATFFALALYVAAEASWSLWRREVPATSVVGIVLACVSLTLMPLVSWGKLRAAREVGSRALAAEAKETLACSYLSFTLLVGLGANAALGWWWADPVAALLMVPWLVHEGREGWEEECCGGH
ncbi:MAG: cation transporter [Nitrospirota bacterium]|jgi:divalent metal cation (Fe/Co/Zn/Cd) transporter